MGIKTPNTRSEFEHNLHLVEEDVLRTFNSGDRARIENALWATVPHLKKVKKLPNGRINLSTINEMIRLQANMRNTDIFDEVSPEDYT